MVDTTAQWKPFDEYHTLDAARQSLVDIGYKEVDVEMKDLGISVLDQNGRASVQVILPDGKSRSITPYALRSISWYTGVNSRNFHEWISDTDLISRMVKHCVTSRSGKLRFTCTDDNILNCFPDTHVHMNPISIFDICSKRKEIQRVERLTLDDKSGAFEFCFLTDHAQNPPKRVGEPSHSGMYLSCNGYVSVASYVVTLSCVNGLRAPISWTKKISSSNDLLTQVTQLIEDKLLDSQVLLKVLIDLDNKPIEDPSAYMICLLKHLKVNNKKQHSILENIASVPRPCTAYDLVQLVTRTANTTGKNYFQDLGYYVADTCKHNRCSLCGTVL